MAKCKKGFTMETKTCGISCLECEHYDTRTRAERLKAEAATEYSEYQKQFAIDCKTYATPDKGCYDCKYCKDEGFGYMAYCEATHLDIRNIQNKLSKVCPFWENRKKKENSNAESNNS